MQEPVAWKHDCAALLQNDVELWVDRCPHCGKPRATTKPEPMTDAQMADCINKARTSLFDRDGTTSFRIGRAVEAHHGITSTITKEQA
jgi:hypothetical protein